MIYVFDVDGTICFDGKEISNKIIKAIKSLETNKNQVIFASARPIRDLLPVVGSFKNNFLIGGNGSITSIEGHIEVRKEIPKKTFFEILKIIKEYDLEYIADDQWNYVAKVSQENRIVRQLDPDHLANKVSLKEINQVIKVILLNIPVTLYEKIILKLDRLSQDITIIEHRKERNIDIVAKNINKYSTIASVLNNKQYIAFGNDSNDYELLKNATHGYFIGLKSDAYYLGLEGVSVVEKDVFQIENTINMLGDSINE